MQNFRNYYDILGVSQDSTAEQIKQAYRQLARKYHPDMNLGDKSAEETFKLVGEAYAVLSDSQKRSEYEEFSRFWQQKGFSAPRGRSSREKAPGKSGFGEFRDFNSFIDQLLSRRAPAPADSAPAPATEPRPARSRPRSAPPRSDRRDAEANLTLPLEKAYAGGRERIRLEDGRSLEVNMPPGMVTGQRIRLKGQGVGGGNLYLRIEVEPHEFFQLQGDDVFCRIPLTPSEAVLGGNIQVPTLGGWITLTIPAGVQPGQRLRLPGKGYPIGQERQGDQIIEVEIAIPTGLSDGEQALYRELRESETFDPRAQLPV